MSTDPYPPPSQSIDDLDTTPPSRYIWAGIVTVLALILLCTIAIILLGQGVSRRNSVPPTPAPGSDASISANGVVAPGSVFGVSGSGYQPGETVEVFLAPSLVAPFPEYTLLATATAGPDGAFVAENLIAPSVPGQAYLIARGSSSGFSEFTPITFEGPPPEATGTLDPNVVPTVTVVPVTPSGPLPDLAIVGVSIQLQTGDSCTFGNPQLGIRVDIQNIGTAAAGPFIVQVNNQQQQVNQVLAQGQLVSLWFPGFSTGNNVVIVDPTNAVNDGNSSNNEFIGPLPVPTLPPPCTPPPGPTVATQTPIVVTPTPNPDVTGAWYGQYFGNQDLIPPVLFDQNRPGPFLNVNWGSNSPGPGVPRDGWSVIFVSNQTFPSTDNYLFTLTVDGGARVYVNNTLIINQWFSAGLRTATANISLNPGTHGVRVEFYKSNPTARVSLNWKVSYTGWEGRYYNSPNLDGPIVTKRDDPVSPPNPPGFLDSALFTNWPPPGVSPFNFSVDWRRSVQFPVAGTYAFTATVDDGMRLLIDGAVVPGMDDFTAGPKVLTGSRVVNAGQRFLQVQYVNYTGPASIQLVWSFVPLPATATLPPPPSPIPPTATPTGIIIVITNTPMPTLGPTLPPTLPPPPSPTSPPTLPPPPSPTSPPTLPPPPSPTLPPTLPPPPTPTPTPTLPPTLPPPPTPTPTPTLPPTLPPPPTPTPTPTDTPAVIIITTP